MNRDLLIKYAAPLTAISALAVQNKADNKASSDASKERSKNLAQAIKAYATVTRDDGVATDEAHVMLRFELGLAEVPAGTVKGYGASFKGYRAMLDDEKDIKDVNTKAAQDYVASEDVKALKAAKDKFRELTKEYKLADWVELCELLAPTPEVQAGDETATDAEVEEVRARAA